jgi:ribosomal protein S18 acetylase RimI-like enzyme
MERKNTVITEATAADLDTVRALFRPYQNWLGAISREFQDFESEIAGLPGQYAPPRGALLLARGGAQVAGVVALRPLEAGLCEMKRLYVVPDFQGRGIGRVLATAIIDAGRCAGYRAMRLDTVSRMTAAVGLYRALGFAEIPPYTYNPEPDVLYFERVL